VKIDLLDGKMITVITDEGERMRKKLIRITALFLVTGLLIPLLAFSPVEANEINGSTWSQFGPPGGNFQEIVQNPFDPDMFFAVVNFHLYQSVDGGQNWTKKPMPETRNTTLYEIDMEIGGRDLPTLVMTISDEIFKTPVDQINWQRIFYQENSNFVSGSLQISKNSSNAMAVIKNNSLIVTSDGGNSWTNVFPNTVHYSLNTLESDKFLLFSGGNFYRTNDFGKTWETIPSNPAFTSGIYRLLFCEANQAFYLLSHDKNVYKSDDFGNNWDLIFTGNYTIQDLKVSDLDPQALLLVQTDHKALFSVDGGFSWNNINGYRPNGDTVRIWYMSEKPGENLLIAGTDQSLTKINHEDEDIQTSASGINEQSILKLEIDPQNPDQIYTCLFSDGVHDYSNGKDCFFSRDGGMNWNRIGGPVNDLSVNPNDYSKVYWVEKGGNFYYSPDYGATVIPKGTLPSYLLDVSLFPNPHQPGTIIAMINTYPERVAVSRDYGLTWETDVATIPGHSLIFDPIIENKAYSFGSYSLFVSEDDCVTWIEHELPGGQESFSGLVKVVDGLTCIFIVYMPGTMMKIYASNDLTNWELKDEFEWSRTPSLAMDIADTSMGLMNALCFNCTISLITNPAIRFQTNFTGNWKTLPHYGEVFIPRELKLVEHSQGFRLYAPTNGKSIYFIDFGLDGIEELFLPLIFKNP